MIDSRELVQRWLTAFNSRNVAELLAAAHPDIVLRPLRWVACREYRGHEGVRRWVDDLKASPHASTLKPVSIQQLESGLVVAEGTLDGEPVSFTVLFEVHDGLLVSVRSYMSDRELLAELGLVPPVG